MNRAAGEEGIQYVIEKDHASDRAELPRGGSFRRARVLLS